jgi:FkbM family methyltransferase
MQAISEHDSHDPDRPLIAAEALANEVLAAIADIPSPEPLESSHVFAVLRHFLEAWPRGKPLRVLEVGCGPRGAYLALRADRHDVLLEDGDDRGVAAFDHLSARLGHPGTFRRVSPNDSPGDPNAPSYDLIWLGGRRAYPHPHAMFARVGPRLATDGLLFLSGVGVASVHDLNAAIDEDDRFVRQMTIEDMAVYRRNAVAWQDLDGDWRTQGVNVRRPPRHDHLAYVIAWRAPLEMRYDRKLSALPAEFSRGFRLEDGGPVSDGGMGVLELPIGPTDKPTRVTLDLQAVDFAARAVASVSVWSGGAMVAAHDFSGPDPESVSFTLPPLPSRGHRIDLSYGGLISAFHLPPRDNRPIFALPGVRILAIRLEAGPADAPATVARRHQGQVVEFQRAGVTLRFFVDDPNDSIQAHHDAGEFYEEEEIALLARNLPKGARVLDVGANIGNHSVAFARLMGASRVVPIEVQPRIIALLKLNVHLNDLSGVVDLAHVGVGFGAARGRGRVEIPQAFNPAGGAVVADENGGFEILPGDEVIGGQDFDLIKIDTEGMELEVLAGLEGTIQRCRPLLFVEVWNEKREAFDALLDRLGYDVFAEYRRYDVATNLFARPRA